MRKLLNFRFNPVKGIFLSVILFFGVPIMSFVLLGLATDYSFELLETLMQIIIFNPYILGTILLFSFCLFITSSMMLIIKTIRNKALD